MKKTYIAIIIIVLAVLGGTYYLTMQPEQTTLENNIPAVVHDQQTTATMTPEQEVVGTQEAEASIDADINALESATFN